MSLPPVTMPPVSATTVRRRGISRRNALWLLLLTLALSAAYLLIDIALDPSLLPHAARAGRLPVLLLLVGFGFFMGFCILVEVEAKRSRVERTLNLLSILLLGPMMPIWSIAWLDSFLPNMRYGTFAATGMGIADIGFIPCVLSLLYGLRAARRRHETEAAHAARGVPAREQVVGFELLVLAATVIWLLVVVSASIYGTWLALTNASDDATLFLSFALVGGAFVVVVVPFFWLLRRTRHYARQVGDIALLASTTVPSAKRAAQQRVVVPPDERPRWGIELLVGLGLLAFSSVTFAVLDFDAYAVGSRHWIYATFIPILAWMGLHRASARRYQPVRFWRLLVAAAAFVVAGDAMWLDRTHPRHSIVPSLGLLAITMLFSTLGVLICRSLLLHPMWEGNAGSQGAIASHLPTSQGATVAGGQKRPRIANHVLLQPLLFVVDHLLAYGDAAILKDWEPYVFLAAGQTIIFILAAVVSTDMPRRQTRRPATRASL